MRIGYVNVQGLGSGKWERVCGLLESCFDYLFLAETWFVDKTMDVRDHRLIAMSTKPPKGNAGRYRGGIYLLGTAYARGLLDKTPRVTEHSVTLEMKGRRVSGVYLPPSMDAVEVAAVLTDVSLSAVVMGGHQHAAVRRAAQSSSNPWATRTTGRFRSIPANTRIPAP